MISPDFGAFFRSAVSYRLPINLAFKLGQIHIRAGLLKASTAHY